MPRKTANKKEDAPGIGHNNPPEDLLNLTPDVLIAEYIKTRDWVQGEAKRFQEFMQPHKDRLSAIENQFLEKLNAEGIESIKTENGTAYRSTKTTPKIVDRTLYLDWCLDNWDTGGNEMLQIGAPQIEAFKTYREKCQAEQLGDVNPPGTDVSFYTTCNIRKS